MKKQRVPQRRVMAPRGPQAPATPRGAREPEGNAFRRTLIVVAVAHVGLLVGLVMFGSARPQPVPPAEMTWLDGGSLAQVVAAARANDTAAPTPGEAEAAEDETPAPEPEPTAPEPTPMIDETPASDIPLATPEPSPTPTPTPNHSQAHSQADAQSHAQANSETFTEADRQTVPQSFTKKERPAQKLRVAGDQSGKFRQSLGHA